MTPQNKNQTLGDLSLLILLSLLCTKLSAEDYKMMAKLSSKVTWFCQLCKEKMKDVYSEMSNLKQGNKKWRSENMMLKDELS